MHKIDYGVPEFLNSYPTFSIVEMGIYYIKKFIEVLREEGPVELYEKFSTHTYNTVMSEFYLYKTRMRYNVHPRERYDVPPTKIDYDIGDAVKEYYGWNTRFPPYIILGGEWDKLKTEFENSVLYQSFIQRYKQNDPWEETQRYKDRMKNGYNHDTTINKLKKYDKIFDDIKTNGYNSDNPVRLYIGRHGEYMRVTGQHRLCLAKCLELDSIPVQIDLVHKQWQEIREEIHNNSIPEDRENLLDHPDLQDILN